MITDYDLSNENMPPNSAAIMSIKGPKGAQYNVRVLRVSFVGELGYELHIPKESCAQVHNILMNAGGTFNLKNAGYRSLYSLSSEKGYDSSDNAQNVELFPFQLTFVSSCCENMVDIVTLMLRLLFLHCVSNIMTAKLFLKIPKMPQISSIDRDIKLSLFVNFSRLSFVGLRLEVR